MNWSMYMSSHLQGWMGIEGIILWHENGGSILHGNSCGKLFLLTEFTTEQEDVGQGYTLVSRKHILISILRVFVSIWLQAFFFDLNRVSEGFLSLSLPAPPTPVTAAAYNGQGIRETRSIAAKMMHARLNRWLEIHTSQYGLCHLVPKPHKYAILSIPYTHQSREAFMVPSWGFEENFRS